jgi:hypothetical protein
VHMLAWLFWQVSSFVSRAASCLPRKNSGSTHSDRSKSIADPVDFRNWTKLFRWQLHAKLLLSRRLKIMIKINGSWILTVHGDSSYRRTFLP